MHCLACVKKKAYYLQAMHQLEEKDYASCTGTYSALLEVVQSAAKIIRALEIIRVKKLIPNAVLLSKYLSTRDL